MNRCGRGFKTGCIVTQVGEGLLDRLWRFSSEIGARRSEVPINRWERGSKTGGANV